MAIVAFLGWREANTHIPDREERALQFQNMPDEKLQRLFCLSAVFVTSTGSYVEKSPYSILQLLDKAYPGAEVPGVVSRKGASVEEQEVFVEALCTPEKEAPRVLITTINPGYG